MSTHRTSIESSIVRDEYGAEQSNPITDEIRATRDAITQTVNLDDSQLVKITRLRLVTDPGFPFYDVSYCYGELRSGEPVRVRLPEHQFPKRNLTSALIAMARREHVYAKGLGLLDPDVISICR